MKRFVYRSLPALFIAFLMLNLSYAAQPEELQEANKLLKQGQQQQALDKVNSYLSSKPKDASGRFLKGLILTEQNKNAEAIKVFTALTEDYPELPEPHNNLAVLYAAQGQYDKAQGALEMAIKTHPSYATAHENLGDIYAKMATIAYDKALQLDKGNATAQTKLSLIKELFSASSEAPAKLASKPVAVANDKPSQPSSAPAATSSNTAKSAGNEEKNAVILTLNNWAKAWSEKNVSAYLNFYDTSFKPAGQSRSSWEESRRERITSPKSIRVAVVAPVITFEDSYHAKASFKQIYHSDKINSSTGKTLYLTKSGTKWLITQEKIGR